MYMLRGWNSWKDRKTNLLDGPKKDWKPSVCTVKAVIKFAIDTKRLAHNIESETKRLVDQQRREMDYFAAKATQAD